MYLFVIDHIECDKVEADLRFQYLYILKETGVYSLVM